MATSDKFVGNRELLSFFDETFDAGKAANLSGENCRVYIIFLSYSRILRRRAASEKLFASTTLAKMISELRSVTVIPIMEILFPTLPPNGEQSIRISAIR